MPTKPCPACQAETASAPPHPNVHVQGSVWYFNCLTCAHTWAVCKVDETIVHHVTPLPKTATRRNHTAPAPLRKSAAD